MNNLLSELLDKQNVQIENIAHAISISFPIIPISEEINEFLEEAKKSNLLSQEEFCNHYIEEMEICKELGQAGWVVSEHTNPRIIGNWYLSLEDNKVITNFFEEDDDYILKHICNKLKKIYNELPSSRYYEKAMEAFEKEDYMTTAMYLVALLEARMNVLMKFSGKRFREKYSEKGFETHIQESFARQESFFRKRMFFLNMYPSIITFLNRVFVDGDYTFEKGIEPPYINRNWLLHGRSQREIERYECIQLFNALSSIEFVFAKE